MDPLSLCNGDAASIEVAADISALLDKVGLKGPKLAASKGDEEGLARQLTAELKLAMEDRHLDYVSSLVEAACKMENLEWKRRHPKGQGDCRGSAD